MGVLQFFLSVILIITLGACGSNNSDKSSSSQSAAQAEQTDNTVSVDNGISLIFSETNATVTLTKNSEAYIVDVLVLGSDNAPLTTGTVKIAYPDKVKQGVDIGTFSANEVEIKDGHAQFSYVGPQDLQARVDAGDTSTVFGFYYADDPATLSDFTFVYRPDTQTPQIILTDYFLQWNKAASETSVGLETSTQLSFYVEDDKGNKLEDADVQSITVTLLNAALADIKDTYGNVADTLTFTNQNNITVTFATNTVSGIVPIKVSATFTDANGKTQTIEKTFNMTILSGPPTAISISFAGTEQDEAIAKFIEHMVVTVTDKYFNKVNTQPAISVALIAGYKKDATTNNRLYADSGGATTLNPTNDTFSITGADLTNVNVGTDILATFGNGYTYNASGKWELTGINGSTLSLGDDFSHTANITGMGYAIGNNYRQDTCRDSQEWIGYVEVNNPDGNVLDFSGIAKVDIYYDYYLTGKDVVLAINILGKDVNTGEIKRIGEAQKITLRGLTFSAASVSVPANSNNLQIRIPILINNTGEWLRNANFSANVKFTDTLTVNSGPTFQSNIGTCTILNGVAYIDVTVTETGGKTGTISVSDIIIADEF